MFHDCRICVADFREGGFLLPPSMSSPEKTHSDYDKEFYKFTSNQSEIYQFVSHQSSGLLIFVFY